ncbi:Ada metal-binding domain-containing protein [Paraconexibacter sp. AEG42_29]|uniref:Ada metal-binding domain-containing protein n=1 Tax=Paraconexibacter sp. AEG42_29 TaxID=2997339 RepID=UPI00339D3C26
MEAKRRLLTHEARVAGAALDLDDDTCWAAVERRDATADGRFVVGVRTTGVYCRPSCAGRPLRASVVYLPDPAAARRYGLRACLRCAPDAA